MGAELLNKEIQYCMYCTAVSQTGYFLFCPLLCFPMDRVGTNRMFIPFIHDVAMQGEQLKMNHKNVVAADDVKWTEYVNKCE